KTAAGGGEQWRAGLKSLAKRHSNLGDVRGLGLMTAVDVLKSGQFDPKGRDQIVQSAFQRGLLLLGCGESAVRFCPPLCVTADQVDKALEILSGVLSECRAALAV